MAEKKSEDLIIEARNFFNFYKKEIGKSVRAGKNIIYVNFDDIASFSHVLAEYLISSPEEIFQILEVALEESGLVSHPRVRLSNIPEMQFIKIRNIRAKHLNQLISVEGIIRQASDVRPQVVNAKFECPSCGTIISVLQIEKRFREPSRCSCGRKGQFNLVTKEMVDAQRIVIEESPESLIGGEQPRRMGVFLKEDLVEPKMEEKTTPGARVKIIGVLKEVPVPLQTGAISTRFDLAIEANNIIPLEETFEEFEISEEDERQIQELAADKNVLQKMTDSIAPSIYGYDEIKQSLVLQLFGGVKKKRADETDARGDIHILLVGDPGVAKSLSKNERVMYISNKERGYDTIENIYKKFKRLPKNLKVLTIDMKNHEPKWENVSEIIKHLPEKNLIKVSTEHGKSVIATKDHSFITLSKSGEIIPTKGEELTKETYVPIPINYHREELSYFSTEHFNKKTTNSKILPNKINLDRDFGFFIGIFLSEGYIRGGNTVDISNKNKEIQNKVINFSRKISINHHINKNGILLHSKNLSDILTAYCYKKEDLGIIKKSIKGNYSRIKKIPGFSFFSPREFIYGLISGLFSGDGRLIKDKKMLKGFELITISKSLAEGASDLLFSIGILNKIKARNYIYNKTKTDYYSLSVPTQMIEKFTESIDIIGREIKFNKNKPIYSYNNLLPCGHLVYELVKKLGYNSRISGNRTFAAEMRTVRKRNTIGRLRLLRLIKEFESKTKERIPELEILKKIANSNIIWSKIKEIELLKKKNEEVYDLSIPSTNTFVANGIGVHNSIILKFMSMLAPKGRYVVGRGASAAGLCVAPGSLVLTNPGGIYKIEDLVEKKLENNKKIYAEGIWQAINVKDSKSVLSLNNNSKITPKKITQFWKLKAPKEMISIRTQSGKEIVVTPNTKLYTIKNNEVHWKEAKNFRENEYLATARKININSDKKIPTFSLIGSNPIVYGVKPIVKKMINQLAKKYGSKRVLAEKLGFSKNQIYHSWINNKARGNIHLNDLKKLVKEAKFNLTSVAPYIEGVSLYKGNIITLPPFLNKDLLYFTGLIAGDGDLSQTTNTISIRFSNSSKELLTKFAFLVKNLFNVKCNYSAKDTSKRPPSLRFGSKIVFEILNQLGVPKSPKSTKIDLSNILLNLPNKLITQYLSGLFDTDGSVIQREKGSNYIDFTTTSPNLAKKIQLILLRFDIHSKIRERPPTPNKKIKSRHSKYSVEIKGKENLEKFKQNINFNYTDKKRKLQKIIKKISKIDTNIDVIPEIHEIIRNIKNTFKIPSRHLVGYKSSSVASKNFRPSRRRVLKLVKNFELELQNKRPLSKISRGFSVATKQLELLKQLANSDIFWEKITKVKCLKNHGFDYVYDLTVNNSHNFLVNGITVHNTATVVRDEFLRGWSLEAGAMVLSNKGLVCIDEIEKMDPEDRSAMHEALEQQCYLPDFEITLADGSNTKINLLVDSLIEKYKEKIKKGINCEILPLDEDIKVLTTDFESIYPVKINKVSRHVAPDKFIRIELKNGREIIVTPEHPCWTIKDGKLTTISAENLKVGEFFPICNQKNLFKYYKNKPLSKKGKLSASGKIRWSKIKTIKTIENKNIKWVYDITIQPTHSFISNNMVLHNSVTISKANVQASLRAETSVLAAANPKLGRFEPFQVIAQQIDMPPTLLNRFDVIFIMRDLPDRGRDEAIATHVLLEHKREGKGQVIDKELFRKYVAYAKQKVNPMLTDAAVDEIKRFYIELRNAPVSAEGIIKPIPISARQLEAMVRLSEAAAKARLSKKVTKEDAKLAIEIMKYYLMQVGFDQETKTFDIDRIATGVSTSQRGRIILVREALSRLENRMGKLIPIEELQKELEEKMNKEDIEESVQKLKQTGDIFEPRKGYVQRV